MTTRKPDSTAVLRRALELAVSRSVQGFDMHYQCPVGLFPCKQDVVLKECIDCWRRHFLTLARKERRHT